MVDDSIALHITFSVTLHDGLKEHLDEGNELSKYEPEIDHLDVGGGGKLVHGSSEDCGHHQHYSQIHRYDRFEIEGVEKHRYKGDEDEEDGG